MNINTVHSDIQLNMKCFEAICKHNVSCNRISCKQHTNHIETRNCLIVALRKDLSNVNMLKVACSNAEKKYSMCTLHHNGDGMFNKATKKFKETFNKLTK